MPRSRRLYAALLRGMLTVVLTSLLVGTHAAPRPTPVASAPPYDLGQTEGAAASPDAPAEVCPEDQPDAREIVVKFVSESYFAAARGRAGLPQFAPSDVHVLRDSDGYAEVCSRFEAEPDDTGPYRLPDWDRVYYRAGGYIFVAFYLTRELGGIVHIPVIIYDSNLNLIRGVLL